MGRRVTHSLENALIPLINMPFWNEVCINCNPSSREEGVGGGMWHTLKGRTVEDSSLLHHQVEY